MQGPLKLAVRYIIETAQSVAADWNKFWYTPANPRLLGVIRIMTGLMLVYTHAIWGLALCDFFSSTGWLSPGSYGGCMKTSTITLSGTLCRITGSGPPGRFRWWCLFCSPSACSLASRRFSRS